jgi:hypothetical protein
MSDSGLTTPTPQNIYGSLNIPNRRVPKPEDIYNIPLGIVNCLIEMTPKIQASGAWWSLGGDLSENFHDVHVRPTEIEILTEREGLGKIMKALSDYNPPPVEFTEWKLDREAEPGLSPGDRYPVFVRSTRTEFTAKGARVIIHGDYQMKIGEWEWGDSLLFEPVFINLGYVQVPLMPLRLMTEIYLTLGWEDRAKKIAEAVKRAHASLPQLMGGFDRSLMQKYRL